MFNDLRHERPKFGEPIGPRMHHENRHAGSRYILLEHQVAIHSDQVGKSGLSHRAEEVAVAAPKPALIRDGGDIEPRQVTSEALRYAFVEQDAHSGRRHLLQQEILRDV